MTASTYMGLSDDAVAAMRLRDTVCELLGTADADAVGEWIVVARQLAAQHKELLAKLRGPHAADCPSRDGFYPENCECSRRVRSAS